MTECRPRGLCSHCGREVALTGRTRVIGSHHSRIGDPSTVHFSRCPGVGEPPVGVPLGLEAVVARLVEVSANLEAVIEVRAQQLAAARMAAHRPERPCDDHDA